MRYRRAGWFPSDRSRRSPGSPRLASAALDEGWGTLFVGVRRIPDRDAGSRREMTMGRTPENPVTGERLAFREETDAVFRFDYTLEPGGFAVGKLDHVHPNQKAFRGPVGTARRPD